MPKTTGISEKVLAVLETIPGLDVTADDLAIRAGVTHDQVIGCIRNLRSAGFDAVSVGRSAYRYVGKKEGATLRSTSARLTARSTPANGSTSHEVPSMFETVGTTKGGEAIIRSEDGRLFVARELDI